MPPKPINLTCVTESLFPFKSKSKQCNNDLGIVIIITPMTCPSHLHQNCHHQHPLNPVQYNHDKQPGPLILIKSIIINTFITNLFIIITLPLLVYGLEILRANTRSGPFVFPVSGLTPTTTCATRAIKVDFCTLPRGSLSLFYNPNNQLIFSGRTPCTTDSIHHQSFPRD